MNSKQFFLINCSVANFIMIISDNILNKRYESALNSLGWNGLISSEKIKATTRIYVNFIGKII